MSECAVLLNTNACTAWPGSKLTTRATCYRCGQPACPGCSRRALYAPAAGRRVRICNDCHEDMGARS